MSSIPEDRSISRLVGDSLADLSKLVRTEVDLARAEAGEKFAVAASAAKLLVAGVAILIPALVLILFAAAATLIQLGLSPPIGYLCSGLGGAACRLGPCIRSQPYKNFSETKLRRGRCCDD
jgi:hypothetical protein